jgi:hypothetical protein
LLLWGLLAVELLGSCCARVFALDPVAPTSAVPATVTAVHDADTLTAAVHLPLVGADVRPRPWRAYGYDAWEIDYTRQNAQPPITPAEIERGKIAAADLKILLTQGQLFFEDPAWPPYGQTTSTQTYDRQVSVWWVRLNSDGSWVYLPSWMEARGHLRAPRSQSAGGAK